MGKKKGKGKKKRKSSLSNLEHKTFEIKIEDFKNKIEWRKAMYKSVKEDIQSYQEAYVLQIQDKSNAIELLEESITDQNVISEKIKEAFPEGENRKIDKERAQVRRIANILLEMKEEQTKNTEELQALKEKVSVIESYDVQKGKQQISTIELQLNTDNREKINMKGKMKKRQEDAFKTEMLHMFNEKAIDYQEKLSQKLDRRITQIAEEKRWRRNSGENLSSMKNILEHTNASIVAKINADRENLERRKELALQTTLTVKEQKREIARIEKHCSKLKKEEDIEIKLLNEQKRLVSKRESIKQDFETLKEKLHTCRSFLRYNENHLQDLEKQVSSASQVSDDLKRVIEEAKMIITKAVMYPLKKTQNGDYKQKNIIINLETVFNKAAKLIIKAQCNTIT